MRMANELVSVLVVGALGLLLCGCRDNRDEASGVEIAVSNSYLGSVVAELCGDDTDVLCLAPPGMCPGHFDISPLQVEQV